MEEENNDMHESIDNYDSDDLIEISLDEHDACYSYGHDANIYGDEFAIVSYVKHEIIAIAPILDSSLNQKHDCNDVIINYINVNCVNDMQNPKLGNDNLFAYKMPMHRKYVRLRCVYHVFYDALFVLQFLSFM